MSKPRMESEDLPGFVGERAAVGFNPEMGLCIDEMGLIDRACCGARVPMRLLRKRFVISVGYD